VGDPSRAILALLIGFSGVLCLFVGFIVKVVGKRRAAAPGQDINVPAFVSAALGGGLLPLAWIQWGIMVGDKGLIGTSPYFNRNPLENESLVSLLIGRVEWEYLAWVCPLPIVAIVVGALATAKAHRLGGVAAWPAKFGLAVGIAALLPILFQVVAIGEVIDEVKTSREETEIYVFPVDKVNLENAGVRIGVGEDGRAGCESLTMNRCLCLKKGEPGAADSVSCVSCDLDLFSECDGWLDDEILDKFHLPEMPRATPEDIASAREQLDGLTAGWTQHRVFKTLPENESTGLQVEMTVRSGTEDRCCSPPRADGRLRCEFRCFSSNYCCAYGVGRLLVDGQPFQ